MRAQTCPICDKPLTPADETTSKTFPFCSERCRRVDFFRWSDGRYAIVEPLDPTELDLGASELEGNVE